MSVVGIDPGKKGGIAWIESFDPDVFNAWLIPYKKSSLDVHALSDLLKKCNPSKIFVEEVQHRGGLGAKQNKTRYGEHASLLTVIEMSGFEYELVAASTWQADILGDFPKGESKDASLAHAQARTGGLIDFMPGQSKTPQDGIADAWCIAEWGWMEVNGV